MSPITSSMRMKLAHVRGLSPFSRTSCLRLTVFKVVFSTGRGKGNTAKESSV